MITSVASVPIRVFISDDVDVISDQALQLITRVGDERLV